MYGQIFDIDLKKIIYSMQVEVEISCNLTADVKKKKTALGTIT